MTGRRRAILRRASIWGTARGLALGDDEVVVLVDVVRRPGRLVNKCTELALSHVLHPTVSLDLDVAIHFHSTSLLNLHTSTESRCGH